MNSTPKHIAIFIGLVTLQVMVLNQINIHGLANPYIFPLFILLMPFNTKPATLITAGFFLGLLIDFFNGTLGMHAFATTLMAFLRPHFLNYFESKSDKVLFPSIGNNGFAWMFIYISALLGVHHFCYFIIEAGNFTNLFHTLLLIIISLVVSVFVIFLLLFGFKSSKK
ncbi:MAG: rod shape-determining protein MreD [Chitinophagales bacterium]